MSAKEGAEVQVPRGASVPAVRIESRKIWERGTHNAFTDLTRFKGSWYCVFRESTEHMRGTGRIRVLRSSDGRVWDSIALLSQRGVDLRDPKLSVTPSGRLMLVVGGTIFTDNRYVGRRPRVAFSSDGAEWTRLRSILEEGDWLWRVTWWKGKAYGVSYRIKSQRTWTVSLVASLDGERYEEVCALGIRGKPNEATLRFGRDGTAIALLRREGGDRKGWVGSSRPPYSVWQWSALSYRLGGPNFLILPNGTMWAGTRIIRGKAARTCLGPLTQYSFEPTTELPSGGDCSYPGMVWYRGRIWVSYYSSHEGKANIYLASFVPQ